MMDFSSCAFGGPYEVYLIAVEGNIAAGKTTLLEQLRTDPRRLASLLFEDKRSFDYACVVPEPIDRWTSVGSEKVDLLGAMYADPLSNAMACQMNIVNTQLDAIYDAIAKVIDEMCTEETHTIPRAKKSILVVTERSTMSGKHVFAQSLLDKGKMPTAHWAVYCASFDAAHALFRERVTRLFPGGQVRLSTLGTVLLQVTPDQARRRAEKRGRSAEAGLPLALYEELDKRHREVFALRNNKLVEHDIVAVDSSTLTAVLRGKAKESVLQLAVMARKKSACPPAPATPGNV